MIPILEKMSGFYNSYVLAVLTIGYILGFSAILGPDLDAFDSTAIVRHSQNKIV